MTYTATDGTVFTKRSEYRKYEMETQYSFQNKTSEILIKSPGTVQGQPFTITNCHNCTIQILDHCDQIQIDDCTNTKIFIGASSESIFLRDCKDCTLTVACKQLRTRDCTDCTLYLYCKTEPSIETSTGMRFACFNGAYPGHADDMRAANLDPDCNLWYAIYDFNDEERSGKNWSILLEEEEDDLWCPLGPAENCCPRIEVDGQTSISLPRARHLASSEGVIKIQSCGNAVDKNKKEMVHIDNGENPGGEIKKMGDHGHKYIAESKEPAFDLVYQWVANVYNRIKTKAGSIVGTVSEWVSNATDAIRQKSAPRK